MRSKDFTIMITTYNRKQRLLNMLHSIERQGHWGEYKLLIVDNCSPDYNWEEMLSEFHKEFRDNIEIEIRSFNCGMSCNITSCFLLVKTKWVLFLSDDDEMIDGGLDIVLNDIEKYKDVGAIKYTIEKFQKYKDIEISSIDEYIDYFNKYESKGDVIFLTMVYNLEKLRDYLSLITSYAYTFISFNLPIYAGLADKNIKLKLSPNSILKYINPEKGSGWDNTQVLLGISTFMDVTLPMQFIQKKNLLRIILANFKYYRTLKALIYKNISIREKDYMFNKFYKCLYKPVYRCKAYLFYILYKLYRLFHINMFAIYDVIKGKR